MGIWTRVQEWLTGQAPDPGDDRLRNVAQRQRDLEHELGYLEGELDEQERARIAERARMAARLRAEQERWREP